ncbi:hypothetical protein [Serratia marcescens]|uniref:hypothetical protein n=1 Tax=Serratia marcescens TaxID=615 RepID=UPI001323C60A|nr:hypothetical protein [Serratia marcescens]MXS93406.1 hypothetical protein [Serratia marcescens]QHJ26299.1 hypothetical protein GV243_11060 [Serratia marcescens]
MDPQIFHSIFDNDRVVTSMIKVSESEDDLGFLLRLHLISEAYLEALISSALRKIDLFSDESKDGINLKLGFPAKTTLALKLGMPLAAYKAFSAINSHRNKAAHQLNREIIDSELINKIYNLVDSIGSYEKDELTKHGAIFYNDDGSLRKKYIFSENETPNRIKLLILTNALYARVGVEIGVLRK